MSPADPESETYSGAVLPKVTAGANKAESESGFISKQHDTKGPVEIKSDLVDPDRCGSSCCYISVKSVCNTFWL